MILSDYKITNPGYYDDTKGLVEEEDDDNKGHMDYNFDMDLDNSYNLNSALDRLNW